MNNNTYSVVPLNGQVCISFGQQVRGIALTPEQAEEHVRRVSEALETIRKRESVKARQMETSSRP